MDGGMFPLNFLKPAPAGFFIGGRGFILASGHGSSSQIDNFRMQSITIEAWKR
jgi:hypothetical protein